MKLKILIIAAVLGLLLLSAATTTARAHNITRILAKHPEFSTFNHYLTATRLAAVINRCRTITVCAVDNAAMNGLLAQHFSLPTLRNVLSLHVLADYFGAKKLHQIPRRSTTTASFFQATGEAIGTSGYINITNFKRGRVGFTPIDADSSDGPIPMVTFVKSIDELPYNISVIQISNIIASPEAEAPAAAPTDLNVTSLMANQGCKAFTDLITGGGGAAGDAIAKSIKGGGLTIFCPSDGALKSFAPKYKNLSAPGKTSVLLYHAVPEYNTLGMLRSNNGVTKTLATSGKNKFHLTVQNSGDSVTIETRVVTATIMGTLIDADPVAIYKIDEVLLPSELFEAAPASAKSSAGEADSPGPEDDGEVPADQNASHGGGGGGNLALSLSLILGVILCWF